MSLYTASEIVVWLLLAAALGFALGWLVRAGGTGRRGPRDAARAPRTLPMPTGGRRPAGASPSATAPAAADRAASSVPVPSSVSATQDDERRRVDPAVDPSAFRGAAAPGPGGGAPSPRHVVKANVDAMTYHTPDMATHRRVSADLWFKDAEAARAAGFRPATTGR